MTLRLLTSFKLTDLKQLIRKQVATFYTDVYFWGSLIFMAQGAIGVFSILIERSLKIHAKFLLRD